MQIKTVNMCLLTWMESGYNVAF